MGKFCPGADVNALMVPRWWPWHCLAFPRRFGTRSPSAREEKHSRKASAPLPVSAHCPYCSPGAVRGMRRACRHPHLNAHVLGRTSALPCSWHPHRTGASAALDSARSRDAFLCVLGLNKQICLCKALAMFGPVGTWCGRRVLMSPPVCRLSCHCCWAVLSLLLGAVRQNITAGQLLVLFGCVYWPHHGGEMGAQDRSRRT